MWEEFMKWYTANYFEENFDADTPDYKDHQRACYSAWQAAKKRKVKNV